MMRLYRGSTLGYYDLDQRYVPESLFNYGTSGSLERDEDSVDTFFYSDRMPDASPITIVFKHIYNDVASLRRFITEMTSAVLQTTEFNYYGYSIPIERGYLNWQFGGRMNEIVLTLTLVPEDNSGWVADA